MAPPPLTEVTENPKQNPRFHSPNKNMLHLLGRFPSFPLFSLWESLNSEVNSHFQEAGAVRLAWTEM